MLKVLIETICSDSVLSLDHDKQLTLGDGIHKKITQHLILEDFTYYFLCTKYLDKYKGNFKTLHNKKIKRSNNSNNNNSSNNNSNIIVI
eukprot:Pgem_evm1s2659